MTTVGTAPAASAQVLDNARTEFRIALLKKRSAGAGRVSTVHVHLAADQVTDATVSWPADALLFTVTETIRSRTVGAPLGHPAWRNNRWNMA